MKYFYIRESLLQSVLSDLFSFAIIVVLFYITKDSTVWSVVVGIMAILALMGSGNSKVKTFNSKKELMDYLEKEDKKN